MIYVKKFTSLWLLCENGFQKSKKVRTLYTSGEERGDGTFIYQRKRSRRHSTFRCVFCYRISFSLQWLREFTYLPLEG